MNAAERQALREKHEKVLAPKTLNLYLCKVCRLSLHDDLMWQTVAYPCDVIKVLNELEMWVKE